MNRSRWLASLACAAALVGIPVAQADRVSGQAMDDDMMGGHGMPGPGRDTMGCTMDGQGAMARSHGMMGGQATIGPVMGSQMLGERMTDDLDLPSLGLNDTQRAQIGKIRSEARVQQLDLARQVRTEQRKLQGLYAAGKPDRGAIDAQRRKIQGLQLQLIQSGMTAQNEVEDVLTDGQREQLHTRRHG